MAPHPPGRSPAPRRQTVNSAVHCLHRSPPTTSQRPVQVPRLMSSLKSTQRLAIFHSRLCRIRAPSLGRRRCQARWHAVVLPYNQGTQTSGRKNGKPAGKRLANIAQGQSAGNKCARMQQHHKHVHTHVRRTYPGTHAHMHTHYAFFWISYYLCYILRHCILTVQVGYDQILIRHIAEDDKWMDKWSNDCVNASSANMF